VRQSPQPKKSRGREEEGSAEPVAVGIILRENRVLVSRRLEGSHLAGSWEFPGGRIREGEEPEAALRREIQEEMGLRVQKATLIHRQRHAYPDREVDLHFFLCTGISGEPGPTDGREPRWVSAGDLDHLSTPPANAEVIRMLQDQLG
jgi:8-oxo-dGTP diphosphatase